MFSRAERRRSFLLAVLAFLLVIVIWQLPQLNGLLYPFRFFVTSVHELGHGLAALLSGGQFLSYEVFGSGAGVASTSGGNPAVIIPAGYIGTALFGAVLLYLTNRTRFTKTVAVLLGVLFTVLTLLFARNLTAWLAGAGSAAALILLGWKAPRFVTTFVLNVIAMVTGLNAVLDLWGLLHSLDSEVVSGLGGVPNDAYNMAQSVGILPPVGWALLWIVISVGLLGLSAYITFWRPLRKRKF